ncbi:latrophilin Cirl isoform X2 [Ixodes scapularis]|uniref:latrophilin Cirl isoform X2 n=1 Tax=Ixodes scapularis TaxID=6945 RepID=UPI001C38B154|nr:latrophilin Cirl isoform X2 [Ixodes scapularis]
MLAAPAMRASLWTCVLLVVDAASAVLTVSLPNYSIKPPQLGRERIRYTTEYTCEGRELSISCPDNYQIHLVRANYGRLSIGICNDYGRLDWSVNCMSYKSFLIMQDRCAHKSSCGTHVSSTLFGDPCPGTLKYLEMQYHCVLATTAPTPSGGGKDHQRAPLHGPAVANSTSSPTQLGGSRDWATPAPGAAGGQRPEPEASMPTTSKHPGSTSTTTTSTSSPPPSQSTSPTTSFRPDLRTEGVPTSDPDVNQYPSRVSRPTWQELTPRSTMPPAEPTEDLSTVSLELPGSSEEYCAPIYSRELYWNWTRAGNTAVQKCPGGATGVAKWRCSRGGLRWTPDKPDLRLCRSLWVENLRERLESGESIISVAIDLSLMTQTKSLFSQDVKHIAAIVQQMLSKAVSSMETFLDAWHREQVFKELLDAISETASNLLEAKQRAAWHDLSSVDQKQVLTMLMAALEESALLLADSFSTESFFPVVKSNILLSVKVIDSRWTMNIQFPSPSETQSIPWSGMQDSMLLPVESIAQFSKHGLGKVVFIAYKGVEDFLRPEPMVRQGMDGYGPEEGYSERSSVLFNSGTHVVNSRVVAASVGRHRNSHLPQPITVTLKHIQEQNVTNPQCVFWNYDMQTWSTEGCWVHMYNSTHTTCACDHLTNFAVLMEVQPFQAYSSDPRTLKVITTVGCVLGIIFLLLTIVLLHILSFKKNDRLWIHRNLTLCLLVSEFVFIGGIGQTHLPVLCGVVAGLLHYFLLVAFAWMFLEGFQIYTVLVEPLDTHRSRLWWYCALAYIAPAVVVSVAAVIDPYSFGTPSYCWLEAQNYFIFSFVGPCVGVVFGCIIFLCIAACVLCHQGSTTTAVKCKEEAKLRKIRNDMWWAVFLVAVMSLTWGAGILYVVKYTALLAYLFCILNSLQGVFLLLFCCWKNEVVQDEVRRLLKNVTWLPECLRGASGTEDPTPHVLSNGTAAQLSVVQQSWNSQDKNSTVTPRFTIPGHQSMDRATNNNPQNLTPASPDANVRSPADQNHTTNTLGQLSGTLHRSSASNNISAINSLEQQQQLLQQQQQQQQQQHLLKTQRTLSHPKGAATNQNGPLHRTWAQSRRPSHGHYSDSSSVYSAFADHIYESIDGDSSSVDRLSDVPPPPAPPQVETFYGDLSDLSQHSSSSYGYDQRPLLIAPLPGKFPATPLAHVMHGFSRDYSGSPELPRYAGDRLYGSGRRKHDVVYGGNAYSPKLLYEAALAQRLEEAATNFSPDSGMVVVGDDEWGGAELPDLLHCPADSPVVMAVLDGEKVVSRIRPEVMIAATAAADARLQQQVQQQQQQQRYNLSTYC